MQKVCIHIAVHACIANSWSCCSGAAELCISSSCAVPIHPAFSNCKLYHLCVYKASKERKQSTMDGTRNPAGAGREIQPAFSVPVHSVEQANPEPRIMRLRSDHPQVELSWGTQLFSDRPKVRDVKHGCHRWIACSAAAAAVRILAARPLRNPCRPGLLSFDLPAAAARRAKAAQADYCLASRVHI